jgi:hypothetical protein
VSFAFTYLSDKAITPTNKFFKHPNGNIIEGFGIVQDCLSALKTGRRSWISTSLKFKILDILIGLPIQQLLINTPPIRQPQNNAGRE